jgi:peroxiredoxin
MTVTEAYPRPSDEAAFRRQLERDAVWSRMIAPGGRVPDLPLVEADLGPVFLHRLLDTGPLALLFFRHDASPACEAALAAYDRELASHDAHTVAVSPQRPDLLAGLKRRLGCELLVASDPRHALIDAFGLGFASPESAAQLGTGRSTLPYAAVVIADRSGLVRYVDVSPDPADRTSPRTVRHALDNLT